MNRNEIIVRDVRVKTHFVVDDEYLNGYARLCGPNASMVYFCLCRHSDSGQKSFPSIALMAEKTGTSKRSVIRGIQALVDWNIIVKGKLRNPNSGRWWNNSYMLLDKTVWKPKPSATQSHGTTRQKQHTPGAKNDVHRVPQGHTKDSHKKDSHIRMEASEKEMLEALERTKAALVVNKVLH